MADTSYRRCPAGVMTFGATTDDVAWYIRQRYAELGGQLLHYFEAPNRFGLPPFYTLHVWAWKDNPTGMFVNWHSDVSCEAFSGQNP